MTDKKIVLTEAEIASVVLPFATQFKVFLKALCVIPFTYIILIYTMIVEGFKIPSNTIKLITLSEQLKIAAIRKLESLEK